MENGRLPFNDKSTQVSFCLGYSFDVCRLMSLNEMEGTQ